MAAKDRLTMLDFQLDDHESRIKDLELKLLMLSRLVTTTQRDIIDALTTDVDMLA